MSEIDNKIDKNEDGKLILNSFCLIIYKKYKKKTDQNAQCEH